jgi:hypothetical protein
MINQSVVPVELESSPKERSYLTAVCYLRLYLCVLNTLYIKLYLLILPLICGRMCDLTFWAHI